MNYEQKYKEALERAKRLHSDPTGGTERIVCEQIFPELKDENERIRQELIEHIKANYEADYVLFKKFSPDDVIAWLEKQGEKLDPDKVIAWLKTKVYDDSTYGMAMIEKFKKDFGL